MTVLFSTDGLTIRKRWFSRSLVVIEGGTGRRSVATTLQMARLAFFLKVQADLELTTVERELVCTYLFERFGMTVLYPTSLPASMFMEGDGKRIMAAAFTAAKAVGNPEGFRVGQ